jgi:uncharacterized protein
MISKEELNRVAQQTGLSLYQQEKDYLLKLFLHFYYKKYDDAIFKGGTCLKYLFGVDRFSEDLDFNINEVNKNPNSNKLRGIFNVCSEPKVTTGNKVLNPSQTNKFKEQVHHTLEKFKELGITYYFRKEEEFIDSYTCTIGVEGPLFNGEKQTQNKFRIDAGYRTGTFKMPEWKIIKSEYPETTENILIQTMNLQEIFVEKIITLVNRKKGRDLYDVWFMNNAGITLDKKLLSKKADKENVKLDFIKICTKQEYERDMSKLTNKVIPYEQVKKEVVEFLQEKS